MSAVSSLCKRDGAVFVQAFERHHQIGPGESALFLNGRSVDMDIYDTFTLLDIMSTEAKLVEGLHSLGFKVRARCEQCNSWYFKLVECQHSFGFKVRQQGVNGVTVGVSSLWSVSTPLASR